MANKKSILNFILPSLDQTVYSSPILKGSQNLFNDTIQELTNFTPESLNQVWGAYLGLNSLTDLLNSLEFWNLKSSDKELVNAFILDFSKAMEDKISENPLEALKVTATISSVINGMTGSLGKGVKKLSLFNWDVTKEFRLYCDAVAREFFSKDSRYRILRKI